MNSYLRGRQVVALWTVYELEGADSEKVVKPHECAGDAPELQVSTVASNVIPGNERPSSSHEV